MSNEQTDFIDQVICSMWLLQADSTLLSAINSAGKEISYSEATESIKTWNQATAKEQKEVFKVLRQYGIK